MNPSTSPCVLDAADAEKRSAALSSVVWSLFLTILKLIAGLATNSLGLLSEALHSALDLVAAGITYFAVRLSARPADSDHQYGYGKAENLSALIETMLLLITCIWIVYEAVDRLFFTTQEVKHSWWGVGVIVVSIVVDCSRARMLKRVAKKHNSQALEADALHFSTDIYSSGVVLVGLLCLWGASFLEEGPLRDFLEKTDALAALCVSAIVVWVGVKLSRRAMHVLLDGGSPDFLDKFEHSLEEAFPLYQIKKLRVRQSGPDIFADVTLIIPGELTLEASHHIVREVKMLARTIQDGADITVQFKPSEDVPHDLLATVHAVAAGHGLCVHNLALDNRLGELCLSLHVEAPNSMRLREAHTLVETFEHSLAKRLGTTRIVSHIEPADRVKTPAGPGTDISPAPDMASNVSAALAEPPAYPAPHSTEVWMCDDQLSVSFHACVSGDLSVAEAHTLSMHMERRIRKHIPGIDRLDIHMEPYEAEPE